jgi:hypothetical protein
VIIGVPYLSQKPVNASLKVNGGITLIVKFALQVISPVVGYFLDI